MNDADDLIKEKLEEYPDEVRKLAYEVVKLSARGISDVAVAEQMESMVKRIIKNRGAQIDTLKA